MKKVLRILGTLIVLVAAFFVIKTQTTRFGGTQTHTTTLANPASVYCRQQSGTLEIVTDASGAQSGICHLVDGKTCDEWAYFRGECPIGIIDTADAITYPTPEYLKVEKVSFKVKSQITAAGMYADRCNKDTPLSDAENLMSKFSSTDKGTQYTFTNTAYENSGKDYGYTYTISVIPNVFGYQSLQAAKKELGLFSCGADAYVLTQVNNKYIVIDGKGC